MKAICPSILCFLILLLFLLPTPHCDNPQEVLRMSVMLMDRIQVVAQTSKMKLQLEMLKEQMEKDNSNVLLRYITNKNERITFVEKDVHVRNAYVIIYAEEGQLRKVKAMRDSQENNTKELTTSPVLRFMDYPELQVFKGNLTNNLIIHVSHTKTYCVLVAGHSDSFTLINFKREGLRMNGTVLSHFRKYTVDAFMILHTVWVRLKELKFVTWQGKELVVTIVNGRFTPPSVPFHCYYKCRAAENCSVRYSFFHYSAKAFEINFSHLLCCQDIMFSDAGDFSIFFINFGNENKTFTIKLTQFPEFLQGEENNVLEVDQMRRITFPYQVLSNMSENGEFPFFNVLITIMDSEEVLLRKFYEISIHFKKDPFHRLEHLYNIYENLEEKEDDDKEQNSDEESGTEVKSALSTLAPSSWNLLLVTSSCSFLAGPWSYKDTPGTV